MIKLAVLVVSLWFLVAQASAQTQPAFPSAEGYGKFATGGRGSQTVLHVTSLAGSGPNTFHQHVFNTSGARTVVFDVAGYIPCPEGQTDVLRLVNGNITIAGQTAPGQGVTIKCPIAVHASDVIIRHLKVRPGAQALPEQDNVVGINVSNLGSQEPNRVIIDHCSISWTHDDPTQCGYDGHNVTYQWNLIAEGFPDRNGQRKISISGYTGTCSFHHNLGHKGVDRNPFVHGGNVDYVNNVFNDWAVVSILPSSDCLLGNFVNNYYKTGPHTSGGCYQIAGPGSGQTCQSGSNIGHTDSQAAATSCSSIFVSGNVESTLGAQANFVQNKGGSPPVQILSARHAFPEVPAAPADTALLNLILQKAGATVPARDGLDQRYVNEATAGTGNLLNSEAESPEGGFPTIPFANRPDGYDSDGDGMPDAWEDNNGGRNKNVPDGHVISPNGYSWLERYLNEVADGVATPPVNNWTASCDSVEPVIEGAVTGVCANAIDGSTSTYWHTKYQNQPQPDPLPHEIVIDTHVEGNVVAAIVMTPRQDFAIGRIANFEIYVSNNTGNWGLAAATGTWPNSSAVQTVNLVPFKVGRYVRIRALTEVGGNAIIALAEVGITTGSLSGRRRGGFFFE